MPRPARSSCCLHLVCWKLSSCFLGTLRAPAHSGCPSGGALATATAASHTGTSAALQSLLSPLSPSSPGAPRRAKHKLSPVVALPPSPEDLRDCTALPPAPTRGTPWKGVWGRLSSVCCTRCVGPSCSGDPVLREATSLPGGRDRRQVPIPLLLADSPARAGLCSQMLGEGAIFPV